MDRLLITIQLIADAIEKSGTIDIRPPSTCSRFRDALTLDRYDHIALWYNTPDHSTHIVKTSIPLQSHQMADSDLS
jgi:hypothetical protein